MRVQIIDDGDNEDSNSLSDTSIIYWNLGYSPISLESSAYFVTTDTIRTLPTLTISNGEINSTINNENEIKLLLPENSGFKWNSDQSSFLL